VELASVGDRRAAKSRPNRIAVKEELQAVNAGPKPQTPTSLTTVTFFRFEKTE